MSRLKLYLLGPPRVEVDETLIDIKPRKALALLIYLACAGEGHTRDALATLFWPDSDQSQARAALRRRLSELNKALPGDWLLADHEHVHLNRSDDLWLDVEQFRHHLANCEDHGHARDEVCPACLELLTEAVTLYRDDFLSGFTLADCPEFDDWQFFQMEGLRQELASALERLIRLNSSQDDPEAAIPHARRRLALDPLHEPAHQTLMRLYAQSGQQAAALRQYDLCVQIFDDELGVPSSEETTALYEQIRVGTTPETLRRDQSTTPEIVSPNLTKPLTIDRRETPDVPIFFGRETELAQLETWAVTDRCRLIVILGMGGQGKTTLAAKLTHYLTDEVSPPPFEQILWRSLLNAPPLGDLLPEILQFFSRQLLTEVPTGLDQRLNLLLDYLRQERCLLILDNAESLLQEGTDAGRYRPGYEDYGQLFLRLGQHSHQSCLLLTSRECPRQIRRLAHDGPQVKLLNLAGLSAAAGQLLLQQRGFAEASAPLIERYSGNPLALKLVADTIEDLYFGDIDTFLIEETLIFDDIRTVLEQQVNRLSALEQEILTWLAIEREPITPEALWQNLLQPQSRRAYLEALRALQRRSLLEKSGQGLTLQNVVTEYLTERLIDQVYQAIESGQIEGFNRHALIKAQAKEHIRQSQTRLILRPIAEQLKARLGQAGLEKVFATMRETMRAEPTVAQGYAGGNMLNLLLLLDSDLRRSDFSKLTIRQAYLQGMTLQDIDFSRAVVADTLFTDTFGSILSVTISPDGLLLAAATGSGQVWVWRISSGHPLMIGEGHTSGVWSVCFSPDGNMLASASWDQTVRLWDVETGQMLTTLEGHVGSVNTVCFSPDGNLLASGGDDQVVRLWDVASMDGLKTNHKVEILPCSDQVWSVDFSPDSTMLASGCREGVVYLWDIKTNKIIDGLKGHSGQIWSVDFSPDGNMLASGGDDQVIHLWDIGTGELVTTFQGHTDKVRSVAFSPEGLLLASGCEDRTVHLWDIQTGHSVRSMQHSAGEITSVCFSSDSRFLASGGWGPRVHLWDVETGQALRTLRGFANSIWSIAFSPTGNKLASGNNDFSVHLWNVAAIYETPNDSLAQAQVRPTKLGGHTNAVVSVCFSPDERLLASASWDQTIHLWQVETGQLVKILRGHTNKVWSVDFSPDGKLLASGSEDQTVRLWDVQTGQELTTLRGHTKHVTSVAFSPNGKLLATSSDHRTIRLWDVQTGRTLTRLEGHANKISGFRFSPDSQLLASISADRTVRLWNVQTGQTLTILQGLSHYMTSIDFSPDGKMLAGGSTDETIYLWDVATLLSSPYKAASDCGQLLKILQTQSNSVTFSPDGQYLASAGDDATIKLHDIADVLKSGGEHPRILRADRPYERMNITGVSGLTEAQKASLKALGAVEYE